MWGGGRCVGGVVVVGGGGMGGVCMCGCATGQLETHLAFYPRLCFSFPFLALPYSRLLILTCFNCLSVLLAWFTE